MPMAPPRQIVEQMVRQALYARVGKAAPRAGAPPDAPVVSVKARHCHLTQDAVEALFGPGARLTPHRALHQPGRFAANETVTIVGPRSRMISNLRVVGPCRSENQVELAYSDGVALGFDLTQRLSGDLEGTPGAMLMGPAGFFEMPRGVIRAMRHVHMGPADAERYGVKHGDLMRLRVGGEASLTLDRLVVRVDPAARLQVDIDTDEGNACNLRPETPCELVR
jgi:putative phosphotransacetylase